MQGSAYSSDGHGHVHIGPSANKSWQTVMSYVDQCVDRFRRVCLELLVFSNPNISYSGPEAGPIGVGGISNNARVIEETAGIVANYRSGNGTGGGEESAPGAPSNLTASADGSTVTISWSPPGSGGAPTEYILHVGSSSGGSDIVISRVGNVTSLVTHNVGSRTYFLRVHATNLVDTSGPSNEVELDVGGPAGGSCTGPPSAVTVSSGVSGTTVTLTWSSQGGANAPTTYILQAGSGDGASDLIPGRDLSSPNTSFMATGVGPGTYYVRIIARNSCGDAIASNDAIVIVQ